MAGGEKDEADAAGSGAADDFELECFDCDSRWLSLERVQADAGEEGEGDFTGKFQVDGPDADAEVEIIVSDFTDEAHVVSIAQDTLHVAITMCGRVTSDRFIRARAADPPKRGASRRR